MRKRVRGGERDCGSLLDSKVTSNLAFSFFDLDPLLFPSYFSFLFFETALSLYLHNDVRKTEKKQRTTIVLSTGKKQGGPKKQRWKGPAIFYSLSLSLSLSMSLSPPLSSLSVSASLFSLSLLPLSTFSTLGPQKMRALARAAAQREQHPIGPRVARGDLAAGAGAVARGLIHEQEARRRRPFVPRLAALGLARRV